MTSERVDLTHPSSEVVTTGSGYASVSLVFDISSYVAAIRKMLDTQVLINSQRTKYSRISNKISDAERELSDTKNEKIEALKKELSECVNRMKELEDSPEFKVFKALRTELSTNLLAGVQTLDLFDVALVNFGLDAIIPPLEKFEKEKVINSAAYTILRENFVELFKNSFDVVVSECLTRNVDKSLIITLDIDVRTEGQVTFRLKDNGLGFSEEMLDKLSSHDTISIFCSHIEGTKASDKAGKSGPPSYSFGGRGKGLSIFLLQALLGSRHISGGIEQLFEVDRLTALRVGNAEGGGALFEFTTSLDPRRSALAADSSESFSQGSGSESIKEEEVVVLLAAPPVRRAMPKAAEGVPPPVSSAPSLSTNSLFKAGKPADLDLEKDKTAESEHLQKPFG